MSKEYYAPALGGIMLSIGIKLSFDDFALALKRYQHLFSRHCSGSFNVCVVLMYMGNLESVTKLFQF